MGFLKKRVRVPLVALPVCTSILAFLMVTGSSHAACANQVGRKTPPNIVLILSDDQAWTDYGFMGHEHVRTPNLDRLADESVVFRHGYVPTALCRPSLMTLVTGHYAHHHGVTGNSPSRKYAKPDSPLYNERRMDLISFIRRFDTLPELLVERGYLCHQSGKWWEGGYANGGFTHGMTRGFPNPGCRIGDNGLKIGREGMKPIEEFVDLAIGQDKPFFLWYAPYMPHVPHTPPARILAKYRAAGLKPSVARYYAMCEWFDETCGELVDLLEKREVRENTLIVYVTDNGWVQNPNGGGHLTRSKSSPYEAGVRTPIMFSWPGRISPADRGEFISSIDLMPTMLAAAGARVPEGLPGLNLLPHLVDGAPVEREMIFGENFAHNVADINDPEASLTFRWCIAGKWKLLLTYDGEVVRTEKIWDSRTVRVPQLFDIVKDPHEIENVATSHPEVVARLAKAISDWYPVLKRKTIETVAADSSPSPLVRKALDAMSGSEEIVFVTRELYQDGHYYANYGLWSTDPNKVLYGPGGSQLCKLNLRTREMTVLLDDPDGSFRDVRVDHEGEKFLFSYRKGGENHSHIYEMMVDGSRWRQLTSGDFDDVEPAYLPDGGIVFVSSRCNRFVPCYHTQAGILYRMDGDGGNVQCLSANVVSDHRPAVLPDGRIVYTRWEYVDRAPQKFHSLWTMNCDGTNQALLYGNTVNKYAMDHNGNAFVVMIDALPIPDSRKVVAVFSPGHGNRENAGNVMLLDPDRGPDDPASAKQISPTVKMASGWAGGRGGFRDPYPLSEDYFLVVRDKSLLVMDKAGNTEEIYRASKMLHDPRVIRSRTREKVLANRSDMKQSTGRLILSNIYQGRNMKDVATGEIKSLVVMEQLPKPFSCYAMPGAISANGTYTVKRILGEVPVESDGSAYLEVPPLRALFFVALDEQGLAVRRMQSYTMVMPGETLGCVGCHEKRTESFLPQHTLTAMDRGPSRLAPMAGVPEIIEYRRDIQPIWDRHCVCCHNADQPDGRAIMTGDYNEWSCQSYFSLFAAEQISDMWRYDENGNHGPREFGSGASPLVNKIDGSHYDACLSGNERRLVQLWIDTGAAYSRTYATLNHADIAVGATGPMIGAWIGHMPRPKRDEAIEKVVSARCMTCHNPWPNLAGPVVDPLAPHDVRKEPDVALPLGRNIGKGRGNLPRHCWNLYNLSHPEKSMVLLAPLAKESGGYGWCSAKGSEPIFRDARDPDYLRILDAVRRAKDRRETHRPSDMPDFRPNEHYVRWMRRFGILPSDFDLAGDFVDVYRTDEAYWRSLWHKPSGVTAGSMNVVASPWRSSRLDGKVVGVCRHLKLRNPGFEEPDVRIHSSFRSACGDVAEMPPVGWKASTWKNKMNFSQGRCTLAPYTRGGRESGDASPFYGPAATEGRQVAKMWLGCQSSVSEDVTRTWLFQSLGTIDKRDVGRTLSLAVDVASRDTYPVALPKDGASVSVVFALGVSEAGPGEEVGRGGHLQHLRRDEGTTTLEARFTIQPEHVGRDLAVRLSVSDPEPSPGFGCHYHFDNVRCAVVETARRVAVR